MNSNLASLGERVDNLEHQGAVSSGDLQQDSASDSDSASGNVTLNNLRQLPALQRQVDARLRDISPVTDLLPEESQKTCRG